ncbi:MAG: PAS domain-containing sensor histidine kinase [Pedobacter sp.]|nr:MAG: PAS domain-containing sensor histidine kinase [Pedobacter sp.]
MDFVFNIFASTLIFIGVITLLVSYYVFQKKGGAVRLFAIMMFGNAIWSITSGFELASQTLEQMKLFINLEYIGITILPLGWFLFCLELTGKDHWYKKPFNLGFLITVSVVTNLLVWTNDYHHIYYSSMTLDTTGEFPAVKIGLGIAYYIFTAYFYTLLVIGNYLLLVKFRKADPIYRRQNYLIIIGSLIPWAANISYLLGFRAVENLDITPFAFAATLFFVSIALYRFKLFDIVPIAREKVMDLIQDGFVILDSKKRVLDYNLAFKKYLKNGRQTNIIGEDIDDLLPGQPDFITFLEVRESGNIELQVTTAEETFDLEADVRFMNENRLNSDTIIIKLQDLTHLKKEASRAKEQKDELQRLNQLKDRIFSIIAHDLRAPLVNLSEVLKMISQDQITTEEFKTLSPILSKDIIYTTDLLENILHWSRSQLKGYGISQEFFDLKGLIVNEVSYHMPSAAAKHINIIQDVFPGAMVYADLLMIQIVIRNILNNAIKFCAKDCEIHISAVYDKEHMIKLCIEDNGVGMSESTLAKLFTGENQSTRGTMDEKGTGLGLVVCKDFMERNNGKITVSSTLDAGSKFCLYIPVDDQK